MGCYLPIKQKPHDIDPNSGFLATANQNVTPGDYAHWDAIGYSWSDPYRGNRVNQVLKENNSLDMAAMKALQTDYHSLPAEQLLPYLEKIRFNAKALKAYEYLLEWNFKLHPDGIAPTIYVEWENQLLATARERVVPKRVQALIPRLQLKKVVDWIMQPQNHFGPKGAHSRDEFLKTTFEKAVGALERRLGDDMGAWQYGQVKNKHSYMQHALSAAVRPEIKDSLDLGPLPRGGNAYTPGSTSSNLRQSSGASFRIIVNTGDWDKAIGTNSPGNQAIQGAHFTIIFLNLGQKTSISPCITVGTRSIPLP